jgi:hypothetical protein
MISFILITNSLLELHNNSVEISFWDETEIEKIEDSSDIESEEYISNGSEVLEMINKVKKYKP